MPEIVTIIVLAVILLLLFIYIVIDQVVFKNKQMDKKYKEGADDFLQLLLKSGYEKRVNDFKIYNQKVREGGIVFVGDSLTEQYNVYEFFPDLRVYNRGIGGDTTIGLLKRLEESIFKLKPKTVVLQIGINDVALDDNKTPEDIYNNLKEIVEKIKAFNQGIEILLLSLYPVYELDGPKIDKLSVGNKTNAFIQKTNKLLQGIKHVTYIDMYKILSSNDGNIVYEYTIEGLHISIEGYQVITTHLKKYLKNKGKNDVQT